MPQMGTRSRQGSLPEARQLGVAWLASDPGPSGPAAPSLPCTGRFGVLGPISGCGTGSFQKGAVGQGPTAGCGQAPPCQRCLGLGPLPPDHAQLPVTSSDSTVAGGPWAPSPQTCLLHSGSLGAGSTAQMVFILAWLLCVCLCIC